MKALAAVAAVALVVLVGAFVIAPAGVTLTNQDQSEAQVIQAITDRLNAYEEVTLAGDLEGLLSYWAPDIRFMEPGMDLSGDEFHNYIRGFVEGGGKTFSWSWDPIEIFAHGDVAYQIGRYHELFQVAGEGPMEVHNNFFARWERQPDGTWMMSRVVAGPIDAPKEG